MDKFKTIRSRKLKFIVFCLLMLLPLVLILSSPQNLLKKVEVLAQTVPWTIERDLGDSEKLKFYKNDKAKSPLVIDPITGKVGIKTVNPAYELDVFGNTRSNRLYLGNKWMLSGVGDAHGNDDWLRLFNTNNSGYYGGLAAGKLWSGGDVYVNGRLYVGGICFRPRDLVRCYGGNGDHMTWVDNASECQGAGYRVEGTMKILAQC